MHGVGPTSYTNGQKIPQLEFPYIPGSNVQV